MSKYTNIRVQALIAGHVSIDGTWTPEDFHDLALAATSKAGASAKLQQQIRDQLADELLCDHGDGTCDKRRGHRGRHDVPCDDPGCCEPRELDAETVAAIRHHHFGGY